MRTRSGGSSEGRPVSSPGRQAHPVARVRAGRSAVGLHIDPSWRSRDGVHGGYAMGFALDVSGITAGGRAVRSIRAQFLSPVLPDHALWIDVRDLRSGHTSSVSTVVLSSARGAHLQFTAVLSVAGRRLWRRQVNLPAGLVPRADSPLVELPARLLPFASNVEIRDGRPAVTDGAAPGPTAWLRVKDAALSRTAAVLVALDCLPPAIHGVTGEERVAPSVSLSAHIVAPTAGRHRGDWFVVQSRLEHASDRWAVDTTRVWSPDGRLLATARQLRRVLGQAA